MKTQACVYTAYINIQLFRPYQLFIYSGLIALLFLIF